jgi:hypothetical protein
MLRRPPISTKIFLYPHKPKRKLFFRFRNVFSGCVGTRGALEIASGIISSKPAYNTFLSGDLPFGLREAHPAPGNEGETGYLER